MFAQYASLAGLGLVLGYTVFQSGGVVPQDWNVSLLALAVLSISVWLGPARVNPCPPLSRLLVWSPLLLLFITGLQLYPLETSVLRHVSPLRAEVIERLAGVGVNVGGNPMSVVPSETLQHLIRVMAYLTVVFLVRETAWQWRTRPWVVAYPLLAVGAVEAAIGVLKSYLGEPGAAASGTYVNRNHFAGLLEICLPFAVGLAATAIRIRRTPFRLEVRQTAPLLIGSLVSALLLCGILSSLSRMGFVCALIGLGAMACGLIGRHCGAMRMPRRIKVVTVCGVGALLMTVFVLLPSPALIERFGELIATDQLDASFRMTVWRDSLDVVAAYPVFGCGLGGFLSAFSRYKTGAPQYDVDYAHNDYLQFLAEIGGIGFAVAAVFLIAVALALLRRVAACRDLEQKSLAAACLASLLAIAAHSLVDFNLYIPANALAVSWVIGLALAPQRSVSGETTTLA